MIKVKNNQSDKINKSLARKMVINISDSDLDTDKESFDDDIYCPTWLKPSNRSHTVSTYNTSEEIDFHLTEPIKKPNKRPVDTISLFSNQNVLDSYLSIKPQYKKIDSPIQSSFFILNDVTNKFQKVLIELIESEIEYFKNIYLCQSIYNSLLQNVSEYRNIFTNQERLLLFQEIIALTGISKDFIESIINRLVLSSGFSNKKSIYKCEGLQDDKIFNYNIRQLVVNSDLNRLDIVATVQKLFKLSNFKPTILDFLAKHNFRIRLLNHRISYGGPSVNKWLKEANFLIKFKSKSWSLETILIQPLQRLMKYPLLLKQLIDASNCLASDSQRHDLNLALIKINLIIDESNTQDSLSSFDQISEKNSQLIKCKKAEVSYDANLEKLIPGEDEIKLGAAPKGAATEKVASTGRSWNPLKDFLFAPKERMVFKSEGQYTILVTSLRDKYYQIKGIQTAFESFSRLLVEFVEQQSKYAKLWKHFLHENEILSNDTGNFNDSIYSIYVDKMKLQTRVTQMLAEEINTKIISATVLVLSYCDHIKAQIQLHRKLRGSYIEYIKECEQNKHKPNIFQKTYSKAQTCINIENQLKDKLPSLLQYLNEFVNLLRSHFTRLYLDWLRQQIGDRSLHEFEELRNLLITEGDAKNRHADIVQFYKNNMQLTKAALEEGHKGLDYFHRLNSL